MKREEIKAILPHREPMLLVDEVTLDSEGRARGTYRVRGDEWFVQGHFPGNPVVPGVVLCEIIAQTACILLGEAVQGTTPMYIGIDKVRFKRPVRPGDLIETAAWVLRSKAGFYFLAGEAEVDGVKCVSGEFSFALVKGQ